jgi:hypothetical protein
MIILPLSVSDFYRFETPLYFGSYLGRMLTTNHFLRRARSATIRRSICIDAQQSVATAVERCNNPTAYNTGLTSICPHYSLWSSKKVAHLGLKADSADARLPFSYVHYGGHEYAAVCCHTAESTFPGANRVVFCGIIVHVLHQLKGSAVMIVQCGTTTNLMHVFGGKYPRVS